MSYCTAGEIVVVTLMIVASAAWCAVGLYWFYYAVREVTRK